MLAFKSLFSFESSFKNLYNVSLKDVRAFNYLMPSKSFYEDFTQ